MSYITIQFRLKLARIWVNEEFPSSCPVCASPYNTQDGFLTCTWCDRIQKGEALAITRMIDHQLAKRGI